MADVIAIQETIESDYVSTRSINTDFEDDPGDADSDD